MGLLDVSANVCLVFFSLKILFLLCERIGAILEYCYYNIDNSNLSPHLATIIDNFIHSTKESKVSVETAILILGIESGVHSCIVLATPYANKSTRTKVGPINELFDLFGVESWAIGNVEGGSSIV